MIVSEVIERLQKFDQNASVYVYAGHQGYIVLTEDDINTDDNLESFRKCEETDKTDDCGQPVLTNDCIIDIT